MNDTADDTVTETQNDIYGVPPVARAIKLLRYIGAGNGCTNISRASKDLGINRTTLIRLLHTLSAERMIEHRGAAGYLLGVGLIGLAAEAMSNRDLLRAARPRLARLAVEQRLSAHLGVLDGHEVIYLIREVPRGQLVSNVREGTRLPAHATTMGRMLLAYLPAADLKALYAGKQMVEYSSVTATTLDGLRRQLAEDRNRGIVWSDGNFEPDIGSCACPVFDHEGAVIAAVNVSGPHLEFTPGTERAVEIDAAVRRTARDISEELGWPGR